MIIRGCLEKEVASLHKKRCIQPYIKDYFTTEISYDIIKENHKKEDALC